MAPTTAVFLAFLVSRTSMRPRYIQSDAPDHGTLLVTLWFFGHLLFAVAMLATIYVNTIAQGTVLIATLGISWTLTAWVPFAIIGKEVGRSRQAGTLTSLHNAAISAPQVLAAVMCALRFFIARSMEGEKIRYGPCGWRAVQQSWQRGRRGSCGPCWPLGAKYKYCWNQTLLATAREHRNRVLLYRCSCCLGFVN